MSHHPQVITLTEYEDTFLSRDRLPDAVGKMLWENYRRQLAVTFPNPATADRWQLTPQGWVGHIPLTPDYHFALQPKISLANLFGMLDYAYNLKSFHILAGLINCHSLDDFYEQLASILARRVLDRTRQGVYRAYVSRAGRLPYVRGRLDVRPASQQPGQVKLECQYEEHTADIEDNQILAWTLFQIARSGSLLHLERALPLVRQAYRTLHGLVTPVAHPARACLGRFYHRLNEDYRPMHALCRFFLEQIGPGHQLGDRTMLPFLVDMARLYEQFVAEWLRAHLPSGYQLKAQEPVDVDRVRAVIDLVLLETGTGQVRCVLDTKYKAPARPANEDIYQIVAYAKLKKCRQAILVYPAALPEPLDTMWDDIRLRSLTFSLAGDLEQAGQQFLQDLGISALAHPQSLKEEG